MTAPPRDREDILRLVRRWPLSEQVALADSILAEVRAAQQPLSPPVEPSESLRGILATEQPAPSDEDVARIMDEERMKKYGG
jgi:hypothetical protein